jgi:hypothetical protein
MENMNYTDYENPLPEVLSNEVYHLLRMNGLLNETSLRDFIMRSKFKKLRAMRMSAGEAIDILQREYPYLQFDTIRKIVYNPPKPA